MSDESMNPWRCDVTGDPCGTDTVLIGGLPCDCQGCKAAARIEALEAENADMRTVLSDPAAFHLHALRNGLLSRMNALHLAGATDYDTLEARADAAESALAEAVEVIDHLSSFSISDELGRTGKVADLCKAWVEHKKAARRFIASQEPAEQEK